MLTMLTEGRAADMEVWRGRDVNDFFYALWSHEEYLRQKAKPITKNPSNNGKPD